MDGRRVTASDVVRDAEARLTRSAALREEARRLMEVADAMDLETLAMAVAALGEGPGKVAYDLAAMSVGGSVASVPQAEPKQFPPPPPNSASVPSPPSALVAERESRERESVEAPTHEFFHGVKIPSSRRAEAEDIVSEARAVVAQGKKQNPYAADRGKNAWRGNLFRAVLADSLPSGSGGDTEESKQEPPPESAVAAPMASQSTPTSLPEHDPLDDVPPAGSEPVVTDLPPERLESHPVPRSRRAGFNNSVPKPPGLTEAQTRAGSRTPLLSRPGRPPSFIQR